jgi:hypothetical protein
MKKIILIFILSFVVKFSIAQNKKEQIIILQNRIDSIKIVYENEILNKKNLSTNIDSITKSILNEYKLIKDLEELNKSLKSKITINNKMYDSLQSLLKQNNIKILDAQKELKQITEDLKEENQNSISDSDIHYNSSSLPSNYEIDHYSIKLNEEKFLKLIDSRMPFFTSLVNEKKPDGEVSYEEEREEDNEIPSKFIYEIKDNELKPFIKIKSKSIALYPIYYNSHILPISRIPQGKFDLICTARPLIGTGYLDINENLKAAWGQNILYIDSKNAILNNEIQDLPIEFDENIVNSHLLFYHIFNIQHPNVLTPFQYCSFFSEKYTFPNDVFEKKKIIEQWSNFFSQELIKKRKLLNKTILGTLDLNLVVHVFDYDMKNKKFDFTILETFKKSYKYNNFVRLSSIPSNIESINTPNFSFDNNNYLNFISFFGWKIGQGLSNGDRSFKININEDEAARISRLLNADRNLFMKISTKVGKTNSNDKVNSYYKCNPCPSVDCKPYNIENACKIIFQVENIEFSSNPDFSNSVKLWSDVLPY